MKKLIQAKADEIAQIGKPPDDVITEAMLIYMTLPTRSTHGDVMRAIMAAIVLERGKHGLR